MKILLLSCIVASLVTPPFFVFLYEGLEIEFLLKNWEIKTCAVMIWLGGSQLLLFGGAEEIFFWGLWGFLSNFIVFYTASSLIFKTIKFFLHKLATLRFSKD